MIDTTWKLIGAGASLALGISILACGGGLNTGTAEPCTFDTECAVGEVCDQNEGFCVLTCTSDDECFAGEVCAPRGGNAVGSTCQIDITTSDDMGGTAECTGNEDCLPQNGIDGVCFDGMCDYPMPGKTYSYVKILDESNGDACSETDPGSDLLGVRLLESGGDLVGWGIAGGFELGEVTGGKENIYPLTTRLDGQPNGLQGQQCPETGTRLSTLNPPPFAMGCAGWVIVSFEQSNGMPAQIENGSRIEVLEYGSTCGGSSADQYGVYLCTDTASAQGGSDASCNVAIGNVSEGFSSSTVTLPE